MGLRGELVEVSLLSENDKEIMRRLMECYYENIQPENFFADLMEKDWALLLKSEDQSIRGFTTIKLYDIQVGTEPVRLVYSGDTIVEPSYWGDLELHRTWIRAVFSRVASYKSYWLLLSKGYKTYRFLPVYFHYFYPCQDIVTPDFEKRVMDTFGRMKYPENYSSDSGVIYMHGARDYLKQGVAEITGERLHHPHIRFFAAQNPGHSFGDELVCLAELSLENMKPMTRRYLKIE